MKSLDYLNKYILLLGTILLGSSVFSQTFNMRDTTVVNICNGTLFDTGGPGSNYSDNEDSSFTITVNPLHTITLSFAFFDLRNSGDTLIIYDGPNSSSPVLAGPYVGNSTPPNAISTGSSITIRFFSDGSGNDPGYEINWSASDTMNTAFTASTNPFCLGTPVTFTVTDSTNAGNADFSWEVNGVAAAGSGNSFQYTTSLLAWNDLVRVIMSPEAGLCIANPLDTFEIVMDTVVELNPSVSITASDFGVCAGEVVVFTVTDSTNGGSNPTFQWQLNGINVGGDSYQYSNSTLADNDQVRVYMNSNSTACLAQISDTSSAITMNINPNPSASIFSQINTACFGVDTARATAAATGGTGVIAYSWNTAPVQNTVTAINLGPGTYQVTATDDSSCFDTASVVITSPAEIVPAFTITNVSTFGGADGAINTSVTGGVVAVNYSFSWNTNPIQTTKDISGLIAKDYILTTSDDTGCVVMDTATVTQPLLLTGGTVEVNGGGATKAVCDGDLAGQFDELSPAGGGTGPFVYSWQYSNDFINWINIPLSNFSTNFNYTAIITADRFLRRRIIDQNNNDSAFSNVIFLDYIPDVALAITGLSSPYCKNDGDDILGGVPSGGTFGPITFMTGSTFSPGSTPGAGPNYNITYDYVDGNGCLSQLVEPVVVNDTAALTFGLNPNYAPGSPVDSLNPKATPLGGSFTGVGVSQSAPGVYLFDPNVPTAGSTVPITYTFSNASSCISTITDSTQIANTNVTLTGFQPDLVYCVTDTTDLISVDLGFTPPTVIQDTIEIFNVTNNFKYPPVTKLGTYSNRSFNLVPSSLSPITAGDYRIRVTYTYGVLDTQIVIFPPFFVVDTAYFKVIEEFSLVFTGRPVPLPFGQVNLIRTLPNSNGNKGSNFQYCENLDSVRVKGIFPELVFSTRPLIHQFATASGNGVMHANNSDTAATIDLSLLSGTTDTIIYTFQDSLSGCSTTVSRPFRVDQLPTPTITLTPGPDYCSNDGTIAMQADLYNPNPGGSKYFAKDSSIIITDDNKQTATFEAIPVNEGDHVIYYEYKDNITGCIGLDSAEFTIHPLPVLSISYGTPNDIVIISTQDNICSSDTALYLFGEIGGIFQQDSGSFTSIPGLSSINNDSTLLNASVLGPTSGQIIEYSFTDGNGCSSSTSKTLVVNGLPNSNFVIPSTKDFVCDVDDPIAMTPFFPLGVNETESYSISNTMHLGSTLFNDSNNIYNPGTQDSSAGPGGTDNIIRTVTNSHTQCVSQTSKPIVINPNPTLAFAGLDPSYCLNEGNVPFTFSPPSDGNPISPSPKGSYPITNYIKINYGGGFIDSLPLALNANSASLQTQNAIGVNKTVTVTYYHTVDSSGCSTSTDTLISIEELPQITVANNPPLTNPGSVYCYGVPAPPDSAMVTATLPANVRVDRVVAFGATKLPSVFVTYDYKFSTIIPGGQAYNVTTINPIRFYFTNTISGCSSDTIFNVSIERPPEASFEFADEAGLSDPTGNDSTVCINDGGRIVFNNKLPVNLSFGTDSFYLNDTLTPNNVDFFRPSATSFAKPGPNIGKYKYTSVNGCIETAEDTIHISANPTWGFIIPDLCASGRVLFTDTSSVDPKILPEDIIYYRIWNFGENATRDTVFTDTISNVFNSSGSKQIDLTVVSRANCATNQNIILNFDDPPVAEFDWQRADEVYGNGVDNVGNYEVNFIALTNLSGAGDIDSIKHTWDFGDSNITTNVNVTSNLYNDTSKVHVVTLTADLSGCQDVRRRLVYARPRIANFPYFESFEDYLTDSSGNIVSIRPTTGGWELEYDFQRENEKMLDTAGRWQLGWPKKPPFLDNGHGTDTNYCWVTGIGPTDFYREKDTTYVISPIFDFTDLNKPMIKVWLNHNLNGNDGVVLEYTTDPGLNAYAEWTPLNSENVQFGAGIKWFNDDGIAASPGKQTAQEKNVGWNGESRDRITIPSETTGWYEARHDLNVLANEPYVRFRFAIGSGENVTTDPRRGFAFDDIWIGERTKGVLLENFANTKSSNSKNVNDLVNAYEDQNPLDVLNIQYHTSFPFPDPLNAINTADPSARAVYYSLVESPALRMDGNQDVTITLPEKKVQLEALRDPGFRMFMKTDTTANSLNVTATIKGNNPALDLLKAEDNHIVNDVSLHLVLIEKKIDAAVLPVGSVTNGETEFRNTMKYMAPTAGGTRYTNFWENGEEQTAQFSFNLNFFSDENRDWKIIGFVQDNVTKEVYQAVFNDRGNLETLPLVGIKEAGNLSELDFDFLLYPNPASEIVNLLLYQQSANRLNLMVFNQLGKLMQEDVLAPNTLSHSLNTEAYAEGLYYVVLYDQYGFKMTKKLLIAR